MRPEDFTSRVVAYCSATGGSVTSWGRTRKHNGDVGGVELSLHTVWLAVDVTYDEPVELGVAQHHADALGLDVIRESDHDHLQPRREDR